MESIAPPRDLRVVRLRQHRDAPARRSKEDLAAHALPPADERGDASSRERRVINSR